MKKLEKISDPEMLDEQILFLTETAHMLRKKKLKPRKSFHSDFLEKVGIIITETTDKQKRN